MGSGKGTALITGATKGIGYELAKCFARHGYHLVLVARDHTQLAHVAEELTRAHGISASIIAKDLGHPTAAADIMEVLTREQLEVDALVNNAGFGTYGPFASAELATQEDMLRVNLVALTQLTHHLLEGMLARRRGKILNVASTAAFQPGPLMAVYYATKAYVLSFSEALANEVRGSGVTVTVLCPGPTPTAFHERAGIQRRRLRLRELSAAVVAQSGYDGLMRGASVVIPGWSNRLLTVVVRLFPRNVVTAIVRRINEGRGE